jgi:hypothetical protein
MERLSGIDSKVEAFSYYNVDHFKPRILLRYSSIKGVMDKFDSLKEGMSDYAKVHVAISANVQLNDYLKAEIQILQDEFARREKNNRKQKRHLECENKHYRNEILKIGREIKELEKETAIKFDEASEVKRFYRASENNFQDLLRIAKKFKPEILTSQVMKELAFSNQ